MKRFVLAASMVGFLAAAAQAQTAAYWRFEDGPVDTDVPHFGPNGAFEQSILDVSGNGNHLSTWSQGDFAGYRYRSEVSSATIPLNGDVNNFSVKNTGGAPGMFTDSFVSMPTGINIETITPRAWTVEASFKCEAYNYRTIVGRDAYNVAAPPENPSLAAFYLQVRPENQLACVFVDVTGLVHVAQTAPGTITGYDWPSNPDGVGVPWYNAAATSDGTTLSLYLNGALVATADLTASTDPSLAIGTESGGDWHAGGWSVGRGLFDRGHTDRGYGYIDEVRITVGALSPDQFLYPATATCDADFNGDGFLDFFDYSDYVECFETGNCLPGRDADFNRDGFVDFFDYGDFVFAFETGC